MVGQGRLGGARPAMLLLAWRLNTYRTTLSCLVCRSHHSGRLCAPPRTDLAERSAAPQLHRAPATRRYQAPTLSLSGASSQPARHPARAQPSPHHRTIQTAAPNQFNFISVGPCRFDYSYKIYAMDSY